MTKTTTARHAAAIAQALQILRAATACDSRVTIDDTARAETLGVLREIDHHATKHHDMVIRRVLQGELQGLSPTERTDAIIGYAKTLADIEELRAGVRALAHEYANINRRV